jgi:hypothetical protein
MKMESKRSKESRRKERTEWNIKKTEKMTAKGIMKEE